MATASVRDFLPLVSDVEHCPECAAAVEDGAELCGFHGGFVQGWDACVLALARLAAAARQAPNGAGAAREGRE